MFSHVLSSLGGAAGSGITGPLRFKTGGFTSTKAPIAGGGCMLCKHLIVHFPCVFARSGLSRGVGRWGRGVPSCQNRLFAVAAVHCDMNIGFVSLCVSIVMNIGFVFNHFQAQDGMKVQKVSRRHVQARAFKASTETFSSISSIRPECERREKASRSAF